MDDPITPGAARQASPDALRIEIDADATLGYASIQNAIPVVRALRVTNSGESAITDIEVTVACDPPFAQAARLRFEHLAPGETRVVAPLDLVPNHGWLAGLGEAVSAAIRASASAGGAPASEASRSIELLAYDQWAGTRALPELLAAFCMPNDPAVDALVGKASRLLRASAPELSMNGYQSKSRDIVWKQVSALYGTIAAEGLQYAEPPASFGEDGQKIRTPGRILEARVATCLDLALLFASALEQAGLRPALLFKDGHAWVGVWLHPTSFPVALVDDVQSVRKRVESGEFLVFETTGVAHHPTHRPSLRQAMAQGLAHLQEATSFRYLVDVHRARELQIRPLPSRSAPSAAVEAATETPPGIEPTPELPPLDPEALAAVVLPSTDTPEGRLANWKSRLLDLTLRNRLLNFKPTKTTLQLVAPDLGAIEDGLVDGTEFRLRPAPALMEGRDTRMGSVHVTRGGRTPLDDLALQALAERELVATLGEQKMLDDALLAIHSAARSALEEGGANNLFLALGFLQWAESEQAESTHLAPILLVPVTLQRQSVRSGFRLARHDDETLLNPTLMQYLRTAFELRLPALDPLPTDSKGIDVPAVLQAFRLAVAEMKRWEVVERAHLGIFSFTKFLMWKDLQDRSGQLKANRVVRHLIENPGQAIAGAGLATAGLDLDRAFAPHELLAPKLADSSQLRAIGAVHAGADLVLEGPPGTGKSQTITNLIAHTLAQGRTVLFVSEKLAALEVVHRRLTEIGLAPFCLELHSSKAKKAETVAQLGRALEAGEARPPEDWAREAERLATTRARLNTVVEALHRVHANGLSAFMALGSDIAHDGVEPLPMDWPDVDAHDRAALDALRETSRAMAVAIAPLGALATHPLRAIGQAEWSPGWQDALAAAMEALSVAVDALAQRLAEAAALLALPPADASMARLAALDRVAQGLIDAPPIAPAFAQRLHDRALLAQWRTFVEHGRARRALWERLGQGWLPDLARRDGPTLRAEWARAASRWWPMSWFARRGVAARLAVARADARPPSAADIDAMLATLPALNDEDRQLAALRAPIDAALGDAQPSERLDFEQLDTQQRWATALADAMVALELDDTAADAVRAKVAGLLAEREARLAPDGPAVRALGEFRRAAASFSAALAAIDPLAHPVRPLAGTRHEPGAAARVRESLAGWRASWRQLKPWCQWRQVRSAAVAQGLQGVVDAVEAGRLAHVELAQRFEHGYRHWWIKKRIDADDVLRAFSSDDHERRIREFRALDERFQQLTQAHVAAVLAQRVPRAAGFAPSADSELGVLRRELQRQRGHMPVRQLVKRLPTLLPKLKPCLLMSPLSVAQYLDPSHANFDLVVFDEASQIPVWDAVGAIARGRQLVVVGDTKQLPPTSFFARATADGDGAAADDGQVEELESVLGECLGVGMTRLGLEWHYRSRHESLIAFSNQRYYDDKLVTFPSPATSDVAVRFVPVAGAYDRGLTRTNRAEAEAVCDAIARHFAGPATRARSIGVVTFNQTQQALIERVLDERRRRDAELDRAIAESKAEPLFIKNLENVQGDERDVILFSITYGPDAEGKVTMNFGPLNAQGGERRLNVAISRAREGVVIFSTLRPEQIDLARVRAAGVHDLKRYLEFAQRGARELSSSAAGAMATEDFPAFLAARLREREWLVHAGVGCSKYRVDLAVVDPRAPERYLVGLECDGRMYRCADNARDRDRLRQSVLAGLGWRLHRLWSADWWLDPEGEFDKLQAMLERLRDEPLDSSPPAASPMPAAPPSPADDALAVPPVLEANEPAARYASMMPAESVPARAAYAPVEIRGGTPESFHVDGRALAEAIERIVAGEGPVSETVVFRRVARAWGLERTGSRITERLRQVTPSRLNRTVEADRAFLWPPGVDPRAWSDFRVSGSADASRRHVTEVCDAEIAALVAHVLESAGAAPASDVARAVGRILGMSRMAADAEARVVGVLDALRRSGRIVESDGHLRRP